MAERNDRDREESPRPESSEPEPIEFVLEEFDVESEPREVCSDVASQSPRFWAEALRDLPPIEPGESRAPRVTRDFEPSIVPLPDLSIETPEQDDWDVDDIDAQELTPIATCSEVVEESTETVEETGEEEPTEVVATCTEDVAEPDVETPDESVEETVVEEPATLVATCSEVVEESESETVEETIEVSVEEESEDEPATPVDLPDFEAEERAAIPELPDFSQERDPTIELPDLEPQARLTDVESSVVLPDFSEPKERPYLLTRRRFARAWRSPATRLIFSHGRRRFWLAAVLVETVLCPPFGVLGWRGLRRVFRFIAQERYGEATRELEKTRRLLFIGGATIAAALVCYIGYVATTYEWDSGELYVPEIKSFDPEP